jgi:hypothetical protein
LKVPKAGFAEEILAAHFKGQVAKDHSILEDFHMEESEGLRFKNPEVQNREEISSVDSEEEDLVR